MKAPCLGLILLLVPSLRPAAFAADPKPPNIIVILTDDLGPELEECMIQGAQHCGLGADKFMPTLKSRIVDKGLRFGNYYVVEALCCPSRVSTLRGQYPRSTGVEGNTYPGGGFEQFFLNGQENSTIATWLHRAGYATGHFGKYMNGYGERLDPSRYSATWVPPGWDEWHGANSYFYYDFCLVDSKSSHGVGGDVGQMNFYSSSGGLPTPVQGPFYEICYNNSTDRGNQTANYIADVLTQQAANFMQASVQSGKPFLAYMAPYIPHLPATVAPRHQNLFQAAFAPRPVSFNEADVSDKPWPWNNDFNNPPLSATEQAALDSVFRRRLRTEMAVDDMIRTLIDKIQALGVADNTYILFASDNGYHLGQHRHVGFPGFVEWASGKSSMYEEDVRLPFYVVGPGVAAGQTRDQVVLNTDIAPTIAALAGVPGADGYTFDGRSMTPLFGGNAPNGRVNFLLEAGDEFSSMLGYFKWGLKVRDTSQNRNWTYVEYYGNPVSPASPPSNDTREFYDLETDPYQVQNVFDDLTAPVRNLLAARLAAFEACAGESCQMLENAPLGQPTGIAVTVDPPTANLNPGSARTFRATVFGTANTGVVWSVDGPSGGKVDAAGRYTAPTTPGTYQVTATSLADPKKNYSSVVVVRNWPLLNITPASVTLWPGQQQTFRGMVTGTLPAPPRWGILENNSGRVLGGTISATGLTAAYTAPALPGVYHIAVAASQIKGFSTVTVTGGPRPVLRIAKTHVGNFTQGQANAAYTVLVSNASAAVATGGQVTVTETVPAGLTLVSMSGTGWSCVARTCTRSDALAAGASFAAITVKVNVAANAASPQVNSVALSGGGSGPASATDSTTIIQVSPISQSPTATFRDNFGQLRIMKFGNSSTIPLGGSFQSDAPSSQVPGRGDVWTAVRAGGGALYLNRYTTAGESTWYGLGGVTQGNPAVAAAADGSAWAVGRDLYKGLWVQKCSPSSGPESGTFIAGISESDPAVVLGPDGVLTAVTRDSSRGLWLARFDTNTKTLLGWRFLGGVIAGNPAAALGSDNAVYIAVRDANSGTYLCRYASGSVNWYFGGGLTNDDPLIAADGSGSITIAIRSIYSSPSYCKFTEGVGNNWQAWMNPGGIFNKMSLAAVNGTVYFAGANASTLYWYRSSDNSFTPAGTSSVLAGALFAAPR